MAGKTLFEKVWDAHAVRLLPDGRTQLLIGLHLVHEVTSPQAFGMLRERGLKVAHPERTFATVDHVIPTTGRERPFADEAAEAMTAALEENCARHGLRFFDLASGGQGVIHVVGPEQGLTQPGLTVACGDSHTSTHGAFGTLAFGVGTSQVRDILATQTVAFDKLKVRRINIVGKLGPGVYAKDLALHLIRVLGVNGGVGYAHEFGGETVARLTMEARMTLCNMAIEGGARIGYCNPDETTFAYLKGRPYAPKGAAWEKAVRRWQAVASDSDARYDDTVEIRAEEIPPTTTWGVNPEQAVGVDENIPRIEDLPPEKQKAAAAALAYMKLTPGAPVAGTKIDVCFIGSCTNGRLDDFREAARFLPGHHTAAGVKALAVPGSMEVKRAAEAEGLDRVFKEAGFEWREPGCSMCLAMNPDKLVGAQLCASTSNRNFKGRQGSPTGRTLLMSPVTAAAAAVSGAVADPRKVFNLGK